MRRAVVPLLIVSTILAIPVLPFLGFGDVIERKCIEFLDSQVDPLSAFALVTAILATDVFLPVPSSPVSTFAGTVLGVWGGTAASWIGMTAGAGFGYFLARAFGRPIVERLSDEDNLRQMQQWSQHYGSALLVVTRAVPVLAEASVLWVGMNGLPWRRFFFPVAVSNLGIAFTYAAIGHLAGRYQVLTVALLLSIALPVVAATIVKRWLTPR